MNIDWTELVDIIDWTELVDIIVENVQDYVAELRQKHPTMNFYAFVLSALPWQYCTPYGVNFHANSLQQYDNYLNKTTELIIKETGEPFSEAKNRIALDGYSKWYYVEWASYGLNEPDKLFKETTQWLDDQSKFWDFMYDHKDYEEITSSLQNKFKDSIVSALKICDTRGIFGTGERRARTLIYLTEAGEDFPAWTLETVKIFNDPNLIDKNFPTFKTLTSYLLI